jgi:hypothetical protein
MLALAPWRRYMSSDFPDIGVTLATVREVRVEPGECPEPEVRTAFTASPIANFGFKGALATL